MALSVDLKFKTPNEQIMKNIWELLHNPEVIMLFIAMTFSGTVLYIYVAYFFLYEGRPLAEPS